MSLGRLPSRHCGEVISANLSECYIRARLGAGRLPRAGVLLSNCVGGSLLSLNECVGLAEGE